MKVSANLTEHRYVAMQADNNSNLRLKANTDSSTQPSTSHSLAHEDVVSTSRTANNMVTFARQPQPITESPHYQDVNGQKALDVRRSAAWEQMQERMVQRQKDWDKQVMRLKNDFFRQPMWSTPSSTARAYVSSGAPGYGEQICKIDDSTIISQQPTTGLNYVATSSVNMPLFMVRVVRFGA